MPHASKPVRYNVAIAPSIHQLQFPWVHTQQILRFFALCVQNFNLGFPQMIRYWGPPMYSKKVLPATKRATVSNNMPAKKSVCFCMTYIYINAMFCYRNWVLVSKYIICFFLSLKNGPPQQPPWKSNFHPPAEARSIAFCMLYLFLAETFPALFGKSAVILYLKRKLSFWHLPPIHTQRLSLGFVLANKSHA